MAQATPPALPPRQSDVTTPMTAPASTLQPLDLEKELSCSICTDILYQPLTLLDCLHTFCGSCLKEWFGWQARAAGIQPERSSTGPYTCPSCRAPVRDTRPNATVTTLLEMYLQVNPARIKLEEEKQEIAQKYRQGEDVLPRRVNPPVEQLHRRSSSDDLEGEEDRRLLHEVREMSLRDMEQDRSRNRRSSRERQERRQARHRRRDDHSRSERRNEDTSPHGAARRELESQLRARGSLRAGQSLRTLEHQASLRTLMNRSGTNSEVSNAVQGDIMREIFEGGLLDELDFTNIDTDDQEAVSELIAKAYIERHQRDRPATGDNAHPTTERPAVEAQSHPPISRPQLLDVIRPEESRQRSSSRSSQRSNRSHGRRRSSGDQVASTVGARSRERGARQQQHRQQPRQRRTASEEHQQHNGTGSRTQTQTRAQPSSGPSTNAGLVMPEACSSCSRTLNVGDLYYTCPQCPSPSPVWPFGVCRRCYRMGQGCMKRHKGAMISSSSGAEPKHFMRPQRFVATADDSSSTASSIVQHSGFFCDSCGSNCNHCYWHCLMCNMGDYGFCHSCVIQARHCTHPLEPLFLSSQSAIPIDEPALKYTTTLPILTTCNGCGNGLPTTNARYHCPSCNDGDYDLCQACYNSQIDSRQIARENGPNGWRKCERGHRMLVIGFLDGNPQKRTVLHNVVGGWRIPEEDTAVHQVERLPKVPEAGFTWHDASTGSWKHKRAESQTNGTAQTQGQQQAAAPAMENIPPSGGYGARMQALWTRVPDEGPAGEDELAFPKGAEITEVFEINESWSWGVYCRQSGVFPTAYGRFVG